MAKGILQIQDQVLVLQHVVRVLPVRSESDAVRSTGIWEFDVLFVNGARATFSGTKKEVEHDRYLLLEKLEAYWNE